MIAIDTGPIVALFDKDDDKHRLCTDIFKGIREPLITTWPVLTEAFYLLNFSAGAQDNLWEFIERGAVSAYHIDAAMMKVCRKLMSKYKDLPMDLADATLVAMADIEKLTTVFTLDHKDFRIYSIGHGKHFKLLPSRL